MNSNKEIAGIQAQTAKDQLAFAKEDRTRMMDLLQPAIDLNKAFATGDREKATAFAAPVIGQISRSSQQAKDSIFNTIPAGPARDFALAKLEQERYGATGEAMTQPYISSFDKLANIGSGFGSFSLNEVGAGLRAGESATLTNESIIRAGTNQKAATMGLLGALGQAAGNTALTAIGGAGGGGGGGGNSSMNLTSFFKTMGGK